MQNAPEGAEAPQEDIGHDLSDFAQFPWDWVDPKKCGVSYGGITGDVDYNPMRSHITFVFPNIKVIAWEIPQQLADMLEQHREWGRRDIPWDVKKILIEVQELLSKATDQAMKKERVKMIKLEIVEEAKKLEKKSFVTIKAIDGYPDQTMIGRILYLSPQKKSFRWQDGLSKWTSCCGARDFCLEDLEYIEVHEV